MDEELKPCPFCGGEATISTRQSTGEASEDFVAFAACYCGGYSATAHRMGKGVTEKEAREDVVSKWNRRSMPVVKLPESFEAGDYMFATKVMNAGSVIAVLEDAGLTVE